ncbi:MAG: hypothetical protein Lokiarch_53380 [Candidatus Lokiarchaeum sp. GC14_75]|nr:MAG: hypothetical protein Lokiarch_53380 [Candidatus Lokiarchaeum sp. GC14_75]HEC39711.1 hypothetical protein [bacterium]
MKKSKAIITSLIILSITLAITPPAISQIGTYTFHGTSGDEKILKVRTVNNQSLEDLFGPSWVSVIEIFGAGAANVGARKKSLVTDVNFSAEFDTAFGVYDVVTYNTSNWDWTTGTFNATPDSIGDIVISFYDPTNLTTYVNALYTLFYGIPYNISMHTAGANLAQLPTSVAQYLGAFVWEPKWGNVGNTVVHNAEASDVAFFWGHTYLEDCTETWTYDETYGAWIGYKIQDNETNTIYEFSIELPSTAAIPGFETSILLGVSISASVGLIFVIMKKKR